MADKLIGSWPHPIPLLIAWLRRDIHVQAWTRKPDDMEQRLPFVYLSGAPSGGLDGYTRDVSVDIDVYAPDWHHMADITGRIDASMFRLAGYGIEGVGYADSTDITSWTSRDYAADPGILLCTATVTLALRPQTINH